MLSDFLANYGRFLVIIKTQKANSPTNKQPRTTRTFWNKTYMKGSNSNSNTDILINIAGVALIIVRNI